jgi:hypothetical protein
MKQFYNILLWLFVIGFPITVSCMIGGCEKKTAPAGEVQPSVPELPAPKRLYFTENLSRGERCWSFIITDVENDVEYLCVQDIRAIAICPMIKKEVKAEHE